MPQLPYVQVADYAAYGLTGVTAAVVQTASSLVDAYLKRPEGLLWQADAMGQPCCMAALDPTLSLAAGVAVAPGQSVVVPVAHAPNNPDIAGEVVILDRAAPGAIEACVVTAATPTSLTLASVGNAHAAGCTVDFGLTITEQRMLPDRRPIARVAKTPVVRLVAGQGRYTFGRRGDQPYGMDQAINLLSTMQSFGGPPLWFGFDVTQTSVSQDGQVWVPAGLYVALYNEVRLRYVAGWSYAALPAAIKQAVANLALALAGASSSTRARRYVVGPLTTERFDGSTMDDDTRRLLTPYKAKLFF